MLRKGPEHVPDSMLVMLFAIGLLGFATITSAILTPGSETDTVLVSLAGSVLGYLLYWMVLMLTGYARRLVPTVAAVMACGSLLTVMMVAAYVLLRPFLGVEIAGIVVWLILVWSVPVKGHIIARAIERHWYAGIAIAFTIFILQYIFYLEMTAET